jgi:hypothetical protein
MIPYRIKWRSFSVRRSPETAISRSALVSMVKENPLSLFGLLNG